MSVTLKWDGLDEFHAALKALPEDLAQKASRVVEQTASAVAADQREHYPVKTGTLQQRVSVRLSKPGTVAVRATVVSGAPHAHLFERGTRVRHNRHSANRGAMPRGPEEARLIPRAIRARDKMKQQLIAIVEEAGLTVRQG